MKSTRLRQTLPALLSIVACTSLVALASCSSDSGSTPEGDGGTGTRPGEDGGADGSTDAPEALAQDLILSEVDFFQPIKIQLSNTQGAITQHDIPIIAGKEATLRLHFKTGSGFTSKRYNFHARVTDGTQVLGEFSENKLVGGSSQEENSFSTINFNLKPEHVTATAKLQVSITDPELPHADPGSASSGARFPKDGSGYAFAAKTTGALKIVIVPVQYTYNGNNFVPDTSPGAVRGYEEWMRRFYPASDVTIRVAAPVTWDAEIRPDGSGWSTFISAVVDYRKQSGAADDEYYYAVITPAPSQAQYCPNPQSSTCVAGQASDIVGPNDVDMRAAGGLGYTEEINPFVMAHEIGHVHGRRHAPGCGAGGPDPSYPHANATIGQWAAYQGNFITPTQATDIMSYCGPLYISDYTYAAFYDRIKLVSGVSSIIAPATPPRYRMVTVDEKGKMTWGRSVTTTMPLSGLTAGVSWLKKDGSRARAEAKYFTWDHGPGGIMWVPDEPADFDRLEIASLPERPIPTPQIQHVLERRDLATKLGTMPELVKIQRK